MNTEIKGHVSVAGEFFIRHCPEEPYVTNKAGEMLTKRT